MLVVDGLGALNLAARAGHARFLSQAGTKKDVARTVFPSTTAAALTSLLTATPPGEHGIVGYRARVPGTDDVVNQLRGWDTDGLPLEFQRATPLATSLARPFFVVTKSEYRGTGFTAATQAGAEFIGVDDLTERVLTAAQLGAQHPGSLIYLYAPELDGVGHRRGWQSDEWTVMLERVDAAARAFASLRATTRANNAEARAQSLAATATAVAEEFFKANVPVTRRAMEQEMERRGWRPRRHEATQLLAQVSSRVMALQSAPAACPPGPSGNT